MTHRRRGFTLLELMTAVLIFALVIGTVYFTLRAGVESFHRGEESMEIYQSVRIGLARVGKDVRRAVSPQSPWSNQAQEEELVAPVADDFDLEQEEVNDILFVGDERQMSFVVYDLVPAAELKFDLREIRYSVDTEEHLLIREAVKSIVQGRMLDWRARRTENETTFRIDYGGADEIEDQSDEIARDVKDWQLSYYDGEEWRDNWDSNEIVEGEEYYDYEERQERADDLLDEEPERLGLPDAVRIVLELTNNDTVMLITEVPGKDVDRLNAKTENKTQTRRTQ